MSFRVFCPKLAEKWPLKWAPANSNFAFYHPPLRNTWESKTSAFVCFTEYYFELLSCTNNCLLFSGPQPLLSSCKKVYATTEPVTSIQEWATEGICQWIIDGINLASPVLLWEIILKYQSWTIIPALSQLGNIAVIKLGPILCTNYDPVWPFQISCKSWSMNEVFQTHIALD